MCHLFFIFQFGGYLLNKKGKKNGCEEEGKKITGWEWGEFWAGRRRRPS